MSRTACTEPQCLYSTAIPLLPLWAVRPVQSLGACTRVYITFTFFTTKSYMERTELAEGTENWQALAKAVVNLGVP